MFITDVLCDRPVSNEENSKIKGKDLQEAFNLAQEADSFKNRYNCGTEKRSTVMSANTEVVEVLRSQRGTH